MKKGILFVIALLTLGALLSGCEKPEEKAAKYLKRGNELFQQGEYEKARVEYKNAARIKPTDAELRYRLGLVEEAEGDIRAAYVDFVHSEEQNAHYHPALLKLAEYYLAAGQYDQAQQHIDTVLIDDPGNAEAHALRAAYFLRQKDFPNAEKEVHTALEKDPSNVSAFSVWAGIYTAQNEEAKALMTVEDGIAHSPNELSLWLLRATLYEQAGDLGKVADSYRKIFSLRPKERRYRLDLANIYVKAGRIDDAENTLREGVAAMPSDWDMKKQLAMFLGDQRGVDAAEKEIRGYMQQAPQNDELPFWLADLYLTHNEIDRATALLQQIAAQNPDNKRGLNASGVLAKIALSKGDKAQAGNIASAVLAKDPSNHEALLVNANLAFGEGRYETTVSDLRTVLRDDPRAIEAMPLLAEALLRQGHLDLAIDMMKQLIDADPLNNAARIRLAQIYHLNGDSRPALELLAKVTRTEPNSAPAWETTARIAIDTKDYATAQTAIDTLDKLPGQHGAATYLRGQVAAANNKGDEAIAAYKQAAGADLSSPLAERALMGLIDVYKKESRVADAAHYIESLKPDSAMLSTLAGECYMDLKKDELAATAFDRAIAMQSKRQETYLNRAQLYLLSHEPDKAIETLKQGAALAPDDFRAPLLEAEILGNQAHYQDAIALYDDILARNPSLDAVANNLAEIIADYQYNDPAALDKARKTAERFVGSNNPLLLDTLAWVYYRQGNLGQAQTVMERAMSADGKLPPQIHYHYGAILLQAGKPDQAKAELEQATAGGAGYPGMDDAKKMLAAIPMR